MDLYEFIHPQDTSTAYENARAHLHELPGHDGPWALFTTDPTDRRAPVCAIVRPGYTNSSSYFGDVSYVLKLYDRDAWTAERRGDHAEAQRHRAAAESIRAQLTR